MSFKGKAERFLYTPYFIMFTAAAVFLFWYFGNYIWGVAFLAASLILILLTLKDTSPMVPVIMLSTFIFPVRASEINVAGIVAVTLPLLVFAFIYYFAANRTKLKKGRYFYGFLLAVFAMAAGGLGFDYSFKNVFSSAGLAVLAFFIYLFFYSTAGEGLKSAVLGSFIAAGVIILMQVTVFYLRADNLALSIQLKDIDIGWGISNNIGLVLSMLMPAALYKSLKSRFYFLYLMLALLEYLGIIMTLSRGNIIFGGIFLAIMLIVCCIKAENRLNYYLAVVTSLVLVMVLIFIFSNCFTAMLDWLKKVLLSDRGRLVLFDEALKDYKLNPLFGVGFFYKYDVIPHWYHNTFLQILASLGIFGVLCYAVYFYQRYTIILRNFNLCNFFMLCSILLSGLYGLIDCNFFFVYNAVFIMFISIVTEREENTVNLFKFRKIIIEKY